MSEVLTRRALNRATLERQLLLRRSELSALDAVVHLVGLQAQVPRDPYLALWSRLDAFRPEALSELLLARRVVRVPAMRATIHLVAAADCLLLRPLMQPVLDAELARHPEYAPSLRGVDLDPILEVARDLFAERPRTGPELRVCARRAIRHARLGGARVRVSMPARARPGSAARPLGTLGAGDDDDRRDLARTPSRAATVARRGRAPLLPRVRAGDVADVATWCRLTGMREVVERLRPRLAVFRDEAGRELFDIPDAPRPDPATPAPTRFLPEYDNVLLSHADRSRFVSDAAREGARGLTGRVQGTVLHDGMLSCVWRIDREDETATLVVSPVVRLAKRAATSIAAEGRRLLRLIAEDARRRDVRIEGAGLSPSGD